MWEFIKYNYYGGKVYKHPEGGTAIEIFNHYYQPIGYEVFIGGTFVGLVQTEADLP